MRKSKEDALFEAIVWEAAEDKSAALEKQEEELNREPIPEEAQMRFENMLNTSVRQKTAAREKHVAPQKLRRAIMIAAACVAFVIVLLPATSQAARQRINELIDKITSRYTEYRLSDDIIAFEGKRYAPTYIPRGYSKVRNGSDQVLSCLSYKNKSDGYIDITIMNASTVVQINTEGAVVEPVLIGEEPGEIIMRDTWTCVIWSTEDAIFTVEGTLTKEEILPIARGLKEK